MQNLQKNNQKIIKKEDIQLFQQNQTKKLTTIVGKYIEKRKKKNKFHSEMLNLIPKSLKKKEWSYLKNGRKKYKQSLIKQNNKRKSLQMNKNIF